MKKLVWGFLLLFQTLFAQENKDASTIKSVILRPLNPNYFEPIVRLGEKFILQFDDLNSEEQTYTYKIEHCDFDWNPSNLMSSEFIEGFSESTISNYESSFGTYQSYINYHVVFPNEETKIKYSGNYIIYVLNEDEEVVIKRKLVVYDPKIPVSVSVHKSKDAAYASSKQSIEFSINHQGLEFRNLTQELFPVVLQNNNWQQAIVGLKPQYHRGTELLYKYAHLNFWAGNEFLYFDTKAIQNTSLQVADIERVNNEYHTHLFLNFERKSNPYSFFPDANGHFVIRTIDGTNSHTEADYSWVHFYLRVEKPYDYDVYVNGSFNNWALNEINRMRYNAEDNLYEASIFLKQGFYNYQYAIKDESDIIFTHAIDGSYYQTENDYTVLVYYQKIGGNYTEVIGFGKASSSDLKN